MKKIVFSIVFASLAMLSLNIVRAATTSCNAITLTAANGATSDGLSGCETVDKVFGTFVLGTATTTGSTNSPTSLDALTIFGSGSLPNISERIQGGFADQWGDVSGLAGSVTQTLSWVANVDSLLSGGQLISGITGGPIVDFLKGTGTVQITENICPEAVFSVGCAGGIQIIQGTGPGITPTIGEVFFSTGLTNVVSIQSVIMTNAATGADFGGLTNFTLQFNQQNGTPEPSTFILMGSALAGIAALRLRKRRSS